MDHLADMPTLADVPRFQAWVRPDAVALQFEDRVTTYAAFERRTNQVAQALINAGLTKGDRIAYLAKNSDAFFELLFGAAKVGVVLAPVGWRLSVTEAAYILSDAKAKLLFVAPEVADHARAILPTMPDLSVIALEPVPDGWPSYEAWRDAASDSDPAVPVHEDDVALQLYTSGTTGHPKGVLLRHRNVRGAWREVEKAGGIDWNTWVPEDVSLLAMPFSHIGGANWGIITLSYGARGVIVRDFDPTAIPELMNRHQISKLFIVPPALAMVLRAPGAAEADYSRLSYIFYGAAPMPLDLLRQSMAVFGCGFVQLYGMTETCGPIVALPPEDHDPAGNARMRAAGRPMPGVEIRIVDAAGADLPVGQVGEVATRSVANMQGYFGLPDATAETIDAEGWLRTGDAGYLDEDGYLFLHDRVKNMIISGGENIYPAEVENAIYGHPHVAEVAVIGVPCDIWGEQVKAIITPKPGTEPTADDIIAFARTRIAAFKAPKSVDFVAALPRNATGKVMHKTLREPYWAGRSRQVN